MPEIVTIAMALSRRIRPCFVMAIDGMALYSVAERAGLIERAVGLLAIGRYLNHVERSPLALRCLWRWPRGGQGVLTMRAVFALALWLLCSSALSQPAGNQNSVVNKDQKTDQPQAATNIDTSSLEKAIRESIKEASEKPDTYAREKADIDRKIEEYTGQLAVYTRDVSRFTLWLVIATAILGAIGVWQGVQLKRSVDAAVRADAPKVLLSSLTLGRAGGADLADNSKIPTITVGFTNYGDRAARIIETSIEIDALPKPARWPRYPNRTPLPAGNVIEPGKEYIIGDKPWFDTRAQEKMASVLDHRLHLYVWGFIAYLDHLDKRHETGFLGWWNFGDQRWGNQTWTQPKQTISNEFILVGGTQRWRKRSPYVYAK